MKKYVQIYYFCFPHFLFPLVYFFCSFSYSNIKFYIFNNSSRCDLRIISLAYMPMFIRHICLKVSNHRNIFAFKTHINIVKVQVHNHLLSHKHLLNRYLLLHQSSYTDLGTHIQHACIHICHNNHSTNKLDT